MAQKIWKMDVKVLLLNCASCRKELLGESMQYVSALGSYRDYEHVFGRLPEPGMANHRRPYCRQCFLDGGKS